MDLTPHLLVGAAIGARLRRPAVMLPAAVASHFVLDWIPHFDIGWINGPTANGAIDIAIGLACCAAVAWKHGGWGPPAGAFAAIVPDAPDLKQSIEFWPAKLLPHGVWDPPWGIAMEVAVAGLALAAGLTAATRGGDPRISLLPWPLWTRGLRGSADRLRRPRRAPVPAAPCGGRPPSRHLR